MTWFFAVLFGAAGVGAYHAGSPLGAAFLFVLGAGVIALAVKARRG